MIEQLGKRLKQLRNAHDLSGVYVADEIGFSTNSVWQAEKGTTRTNIEFMANICKFYGVSMDLLVLGSDADFQRHIDSVYTQEIDADLVETMIQQGYGRANTRWHT